MQGQRTSAEGQPAANVLGVLGQDNGNLMLVNLAKGECTTLFEGHTNWILALDVNWSTMRALSGGGDGSVYLWDLAEGTGQNLADGLDSCGCVRAIAVQWNPPPSESFSAALQAMSGMKAQHGSKNKRQTMCIGTSMRAGDGTTRSDKTGSRSTISPDATPKRRPALHRSATTPLHAQSSAPLRRDTGKPSFGFSEPQTIVRALTGSDDGRLLLWDLTGEYLEKAYDFRLRIITALAVDWTRHRVLVGHGDSDLDLIDLKAATTLRSIQGHSCVMGAICVSWAKSLALCGSGDGTLAVWDVRRGSQVRSLKGHAGGISAAKAHWPSMRAVTGSTDHSLRLWSLKQGSCLQILARHEHPIRSLSIDWRSGRVMSTATAGPVFIWDTKDSTKEPEELKLPELDAVCAGVVCMRDNRDEVGGDSDEGEVP